MSDFSYIRFITPAAAFTESAAGIYAYLWYLKDHLGSIRVLADEGGNAVSKHDYDPFGDEIALAGTGSLYPFPPGGTESPYQYGGKEWNSTTSTYDFGARHFTPTLPRWLTMDPLCEKYYGVSPYVYCASNPVNRIDPYGKDDYRYDDKTGTFYLMKHTSDTTDRVLGYHLNRITGEYEQNTKWYQTKVWIDGIEKGILSDGINFMTNDNVISVGGEGQPTVDGVEEFVVLLSDMVGREIGGAYFSKEGTSSITHISLAKNCRNSYNENKGGHGHNLWQRLNQDSKLETSLIGFFHTHPSGANISVSDRIQPSQRDIESRDKALDKMPNLQFFILTHPIYYSDKFPYKIPYTLW